MAHQTKCDKCNRMHKTHQISEMWFYNGFYSHGTQPHPDAKRVNVGQTCYEKIWKEQGKSFDSPLLKTA